MADRNEILEFFRKYKSELLNKYELRFVALFGSYARQEQNEQSDIDLLIEFNDNVKDLHKKKRELKKEISNRFNVDVDICRDKYIKDYFRDLIYRDAIYF